LSNSNPASLSLNARPNNNPLLDVIRHRTPLLDVRAPIEFDQGSVPNSHNIAILNNNEREQVGTAYQKHGNQTATALGHQLVCGETKEMRVHAWATWLEANPNAQVMCWRGGQRSSIACTWLAQINMPTQRLAGGYKALRRTCVEILDQAAEESRPWWVIAGRTGVKKTVLIGRVSEAIDLEDLARHRGSAFGAYPEGQPSLASFENRIAYDYVEKSHTRLVLEDESRTIGRLAVPQAWHARMQRSPLLLLEATVAQRVEHIRSEYIDQAMQTPLEATLLQNRYQQALKRIARRLGGVQYELISKLLVDSFDGHCSHDSWVHALLTHYYDPMYDYQLKKKQSRIVFRGDMDSIQDYLSGSPSI